MSLFVLAHIEGLVLYFLRMLSALLLSEWIRLVRSQEDQNRGKANWEHLNEDLHVLITVEDSENRARIKLQRAVDEVKKLLVPMVSSTAHLLV